MSIPAWKVISWAPVSTTVQHWNRIVKDFLPLGNAVYVDAIDGLHHGQVVWGLEAEDMSVGIAWDWREAFPGVVAMSDPMTVLTNVTLIGVDHCALPFSTRILHLNSGIYQLPWQAHIASLTRRSEAALRKTRTQRQAANLSEASLAA